MNAFDSHSPTPGGASASSEPRSLDVPRELGDVRGSDPNGPLLVVTAGIHGNEPSGVYALRRVLDALAEDDTGLVGRLVALSGNRAALHRNLRYVAHDMNRAWVPEILERVREGDPSELRDEDREIRGLDEALRRVLPDAAALLDLHSTSGPGKPFVTMDDTLRNRYFARALPVPRVLGLEEELAGTLTGHIIHEFPIPAIGFEGGRHDDETTIEHAEAAVWIALESAGVLRRGSRSEPERSRALLAERSGGLAAVVEVRHRHEVRPESGFRMEPGFHSFQRVARGQLLALEVNGPIKAPVSALMLMPRYQGIGSDGFFLVRPVHPIWLALSAWLRRLQAWRWVHWLPGVRRHPARDGSFVVDRRRARVLVAEIFHLLGFRREPATGDETVMTPRDGSNGVS